MVETKFPSGRVFRIENEAYAKWIFYGNPAEYANEDRAKRILELYRNSEDVLFASIEKAGEEEMARGLAEISFTMFYIDNGMSVPKFPWNSNN